ncbi:peptidyl-prolyl cis-trans isomerase FKBP17-2, chloroplastic-like [Triticum dicoccoides]|uniref:peptidyl-prolyl cis-trans isomerase FKBP17-2, chloroplastic-like n=1 Tax=Triticum dicoccoides TaxID=85692 RepID=UPI00188EE888|nr:peptidyl-prolyl cis-trans isomerase FKBP17-2, chloroplastic-like [Triticum dicoccoides]
MATFLGSSPAFLARPAAKPHVSCSPPSRPPSAQPPSDQPPPPPQQQQEPMQAQAAPARAPAPKRAATSADSTDWVASSLTRRFGIGAGLAWVGFLAFGVVSEQLKTRFEVAQQEANTKDVEEEQEVVLPNGIRYTEMRVGGGDVPRPGDLVVIDLQGRLAGGGEAFVDTFGDGKRPLALVMGSRPYTRGMCEGIEYALRSMRNGGKRRVVVPASLGFGEDGADFGDDGAQVPPGATLEYVVQVDKVSIAPA